MELRHLRYFLAVAEAGSVTAAAGQLRVAQPHLSREIRALERAVGRTLFARSPRGAALTEAGHRLLPRAHAVVQEAAQLVDAVRDAPGVTRRSRLGISVDAVARIAPYLRALRRIRPDLAYDTVRSSSGRLNRMLDDGEVDAVVTWWVDPGHRPTSGAVLTETTVAVLPQRHDLAALPVVTPAQLGAAGPVAMFAPRHGRPAYQGLTTLLTGRDNDPRFLVGQWPDHVGGQQEMIRLAAGHDACTLVSTFNWERLDHHGLVARPLDVPPAPVTIDWTGRTSALGPLLVEGVRAIAAVHQQAAAAPRDISGAGP